VLAWDINIEKMRSVPKIEVPTPRIKERDRNETRNTYDPYSIGFNWNTFKICPYFGAIINPQY
jgi:hypothetical protein